MKLNNESIVRNSESVVRRLREGQRGQSMVLMAFALVGLLGLAGLVMDLGRVIYAYQELQAATQAAALAGGTVLSNDTAAEAIATATNYSAANGDLNASSNLTNVTMVTGYPKVECLTSIGTVCSASPADANAIAVSEQATVPMLFAKALGISSMQIAATATASGTGGSTNRTTWRSSSTQRSR